MSGHDHTVGDKGADPHCHDAHGHDDAHGHPHRRDPVGFVIEWVGGPGHDHAGSLDDSLMANRAGVRALAISSVGLLVTAVLELIVFSVSGSVGLLADTIHNFADAFTAIPVGMALLIARRPATRRYTYGFGRSEDLAGLAVPLVIAASAVIAAWEAVSRIVHPSR